MRFYDEDAALIGSAGETAICRVQTISDDYLDSLKEARFASSGPSGEFHRVCSVPVIFINKWLREGFNYFNAPHRDVIARLHREGLDGFITTNKRI